jgi:CRISPR-associated endoribonuclease Cas6
MRLLLELTSLDSHPYINDYYYSLQGAIYSLLREGGLQNIHDKKGYKYFCFSNLFPVGNFDPGRAKRLLISSPGEDMIEAIRNACYKRLDNQGGLLSVSGIRLKISKISKPFRLQFRESEVRVRTSTPIIMRIPESKYGEYGISPAVEYKYMFWRETLPLEIFIKQLRDNASKKWKDYTASTVSEVSGSPCGIDTDAGILPEVTYYKFIKSVSKPIVVRQREHLVIGSLWEMGFSLRSSREKDCLEFVLDCGLGERNSLGFGFVNAIRLSGQF